VSRRLRDLVEPIAANVYFAPEATAAFKELGLKWIPAYFTSRGGCMGQVPGEVVVAAFGVFSPAVVIPAVDEGWSKTDRDTILDARLRGATASLERILGPRPEGLERATELLRRCADAATGEGRHLFSGLRSLGYPGTPMGDLWRAADLVREHRGDSHICAWTSHGIDAIQANLLTELWWGMPFRSYVVTRGWTEAEIDGAVARLEEDGIVKGDAFTPEGEELRAAIEAATDVQETRIVEALGDDADELFGLLDPWTTALVEAKGYPGDPRKYTRP
jgi:hypothetical protein